MVRTSHPLFVPPNPHHLLTCDLFRLLKHGHTEVATEIMSRLEDLPADSDQIKQDVAEIQAINNDAAGNLTIREFFSNGKAMNGWRASAGILSQAFQQIGTSTFPFPPLPLSSISNFPSSLQAASTS